MPKSDEERQEEKQSKTNAEANKNYRGDFSKNIAVTEIQGKIVAVDLILKYNEWWLNTNNNCALLNIDMPILTFDLQIESIDYIFQAKTDCAQKKG